MFSSILDTYARSASTQHSHGLRNRIGNGLPMKMGLLCFTAFLNIGCIQSGADPADDETADPSIENSMDDAPDMGPVESADYGPLSDPDASPRQISRRDGAVPEPHDAHIEAASLDPIDACQRMYSALCARSVDCVGTHQELLDRVYPCNTRCVDEARQTGPSFNRRFSGDAALFNDCIDSIATAECDPDDDPERQPYIPVVKTDECRAWFRSAPEEADGDEGAGEGSYREASADAAPACQPSLKILVMDHSASLDGLTPDGEISDTPATDRFGHRRAFFTRWAENLPASVYISLVKMNDQGQNITGCEPEDGCEPAPRLCSNPTQNRAVVTCGLEALDAEAAGRTNLNHTLRSVFRSLVIPNAELDTEVIVFTDGVEDEDLRELFQPGQAYELYSEGVGNGSVPVTFISIHTTDSIEQVRNYETLRALARMTGGDYYGLTGTVSLLDPNISHDITRRISRCEE